MSKRTAEEQAELVAKLIDNASDVIAVIDQNGTISFQSPSVERVLGYPPAELDGTSVFGLVHPDDLEGAWLRMEQVLTEAGTTRVSLIRLRHRDGSWRTLEAVGTAMFDDPLVNGIVVNARDVTERLWLEQQLHEAQKMEAVGRLAAGIAHHFNNLLTVIGGYSTVLLAGLGPDHPLRPEAAEINQAAQRAGQLTRRLLAFSTEAPGERGIVDPNELIRTLAGSVEDLLRDDIVLELELDPTAPRIRVDPRQLEQVILNLVLNAADALPGPGRLTISTSTGDPGQAGRPAAGSRHAGYLHLAVADTGVGMDELTKAHLFEPFYTTKPIGQATGLGLTTVYRIVTANGGTIEFDSRPAQGSTFHVYMPAVESEPGEQAAFDRPSR